MEDNILPLYYTHSSISRRGISGKWIHLIPIGILLSLFILWWFSYPVMLEIRDGRIKDIHKIIDEVVPLNESTAYVDLTILAMATATVSAPPLTSITQRHEQVDNKNAKVYTEIAAEPMSNYKIG
ncbi:hypothetical protein RND71_021013 [Anisodus tanguticus]|uniref:Uncharacterized protein n=1 Tax=Anisodus tanguticus TaxID=243964 RepID=A0AAE1RUG7_9SOLA|nr:hypothetical protein RND71_021013 [Anisodus tanguticus]